MHSTPIVPSLFAALFGLTAASQVAEAAPRIDFGSHFHVRLNHSTERDGGKPVGKSRIEVAATILDAGAADLSIEATQGRKKVATFGCTVTRKGRPTRCESEWLDADAIDARKNLDIAIRYVDEATDAETQLYAGSFPVHQFWDWVGNVNSRPQHVEQRALNLDSALGAAFVSQVAFGHATASDGSQTVIDSMIKLSYWDATENNRNEKAKLRCKVGDGEWAAYRISGPSPENDDQRVLNRVWGRDKSVHEGEGESIYYQQHRFTMSVPFWVQGAEERLSAPSADANGDWTCQLRRGSGSDRRVVREFHFRVEDNTLVPHAAQGDLPMAAGSALIGVAFDAENLPVSFDPKEVRRGFMGKSWADAAKAPVAGDLPSRPRAPSFTRPGRR